MADLYKVLGLNKSDNITKAQIRKAYLNLALKHHPDKGGNETTFQKISNAYNVLIDDDKRNQYDADNETYQTDEVESRNFSDRQSIIIHQLFDALKKMDTKIMEMVVKYGGGASIILGLISYLTDDSFTKGFKTGLALSISFLKPEILSHVDEEYREDAKIYLNQFIENIGHQ